MEIAEITSSTDALHRAVRANDVTLLTILLQGGALVNARDSYSRTALPVACQYADFQNIILELLSSGAEVNSKDWRNPSSWGLSEDERKRSGNNTEEWSRCKSR